MPTYLAATPSELTLRRRYAATMAAAYAALDEGAVDTAQVLLDSLRPTAHAQDLRQFDWYHLWRRTHQGSDRLPGHGYPVLEMVRLPGKDALATLFTDGTLRVNDGKSLSLRSIRYQDSRINQGAVAATGTAWAMLDHNSEIVVRDVETGLARPPLKLPERRVDIPAVCQAFALSPDGKRAVLGGELPANQPAARPILRDAPHSGL